MSHGASLHLYLAGGCIYHHSPACEWLPEEARRAGIAGGTAFRAIAGLGKTGTMRNAGFFELAGKLLVEAASIFEGSQTRQFLAKLGAADLMRQMP